MQFRNIGILVVVNLLVATFSFGQKGGDFAFVADEPHYLLITMTNHAIDIPDVRAEITKYVWRNHAADKLSITHILIGKNHNTNAMLLEEFTDKAHAMNFYKKMQVNRPDFMQLNLTKEYLVISKSNYEQILRNQSLKGYATFFKEKYLK